MTFRARLLLCACTSLLAVSPAVAGQPQPKSVVPFDFVSQFDQGRYGQMLGEMIWKKLRRQGGFVLPETMLDVRETCQQKHVHPGPLVPLEQLGKLVREDFDAQIGIWGSVERVAGHDEDVYDLVIRCVDFSAAGQPKTVYQCSVRTKTVSEIPHVYVAQLLDALSGRTPGGPAAPDALAERNWLKNANLLPGGDFQSGRDGVPLGWEATAGQRRQPLGTLVRWTAEEGNPYNKVIRFTFGAEVGDNEGVMYYSQPFPVQEGAKYRFQCRWRTNGPAVKVFIKCYDEIDSRFRPAPSEARPSAQDAPRGRLQEVYRSQQNLTGPKNTWNTHREDFTPAHSNFTPRWGRVMLYAYIGGGVVEFDDVIVKQISSASPGQTVNKQPRPSAESNVTTKEMEENRDRRGK